MVRAYCKEFNCFDAVKYFNCSNFVVHSKTQNKMWFDAAAGGDGGGFVKDL